jgi:hypothetical protein
VKLKILFLASAVAVLSLSGVAPQPPQSHPLSEIVPVDTDLNMSNYNIENASSIRLNNGIGSPGFLINGFTITHPGEAQEFVLDYQNDEWDLIASNLDLNSNNVSQINFLNPGASPLAVGGYLDVNAPVNTGNALDVGGTIGADGGINSYSGVDMNGNNISSSDGEMCIGEYC